MLLYTDRVNVSFRLTMRWGSSGAGAAAPQERMKSWVNHGSEYWYMGSTSPRSAMTKYSREARLATGRYSSLCTPISSVITLASASFSLISLDVSLDCASVSMSTVSSKMLPVELDSK